MVRRPDDQGLRRAERDVVGTAGYEAARNDFAPRCLQALLWLDDVRRFGSAMLVDAVGTHPTMPIGNLLVENSRCMPALEPWVSGADSVGVCEHRGQGGAE
ncbi:MEDS domain-containing protein [Pseudonocardia kujensis]|uniref:MEDS domain-containing protein n=1 Tax=Pseudonocardia kujensis TaxID=1128675 RepID=UPI001E38ABDB|nr:MEDS domain-containing protein [Pseudonocardia kujensis]MCE0767360.1 MEDS domain-containing protein [Pseudonocardia kujensis]